MQCIFIVAFVCVPVQLFVGIMDFSNHLDYKMNHVDAHGVLFCVFSGFSAGFLQHSNDAVGGSTSKASLGQLQSLAMNGLNMLSQSQTQCLSSTKNQR